MNKKVKIVFTVSVLLNVFLVGLLVGSMSKEFNHEVHIKNRAKHELGQFAHILPEPQRAAFISDFKRLAENNRDTRRKIAAVREEVAILFKTDPFDEALFYLKTQEMHDLRGKQMFESAEIIGRMASQLPPEKREMLNQKLAMGKRRLMKMPHEHHPPRFLEPLPPTMD